MAEWAPKRFWKEAAVTAVDGGHTVTLDARPVRTPAKAPLVVPSRALALVIAAEWDAQQDVVRPDTMPVTRTANSAIDKVTPQSRAVADMLADYGGTDLLCYRAEGPDELVALQSATWDPMLDWAEATHGARLVTTAGVMPVAQDARALENLSAPLYAMSPFELAATHDLVALTGSLVLGLAAVADARPPSEIWEISRVDEEWQAGVWGRDEEADAMAARKRDDFLHAHRMLGLIRAA